MQTLRIPTAFLRTNGLPALNTRLPRTIRITHAEYVPPGFHARFSATGKTYRYCISRAPILNPFDAGLAWHRPLAWSADILEQAVHLFRGTHDFTAFAALRGNEPRPYSGGLLPPNHHADTSGTGRGTCLHHLYRNGFPLQNGAPHDGAAHEAHVEK